MSKDQEIWAEILEIARGELPPAVVESILSYAVLHVNCKTAQLIFPHDYMPNLLQFKHQDFIRDRIREKYGAPVDLEIVINEQLTVTRPADDVDILEGPERREKLLLKTPVTADTLWDDIKADYKRKYGGSYISAPKKTKKGTKVSERAILDKMIASEKDGGYGYVPATVRFAWCRYLDNTTDVREIWKGVANFANMCNMFLREAITGGPPNWAVREGPMYRCGNPRCYGKIRALILHNDDGEAPIRFHREKCPIFINRRGCKARYFRNDYWEERIKPRVLALEEKRALKTPEKPQVEQKPVSRPDIPKSTPSKDFTPIGDVVPPLPEEPEPEFDLDAVDFFEDDPLGLGGKEDFK